MEVRSRYSKIKAQNAEDVYRFIEKSSVICEVLKKPSEKLGGYTYKPKIICAVSDKETADQIVAEVNRMATEASLELNSIVKFNDRPPIRYRFTILELEDPTVRLSTRPAYRVEYKTADEILKKFQSTLSSDMVAKWAREAAEDMVKQLREAARKKEIDFKSKKLLRYAYCTGESYKVNAFVDGSTTQQNANDICILIFSDPKAVRVEKSPKRKKRSDASSNKKIAYFGPYEVTHGNL